MAALARDLGAEQGQQSARSRRRIVWSSGPGPPTSIVPGRRRAPHSSIISCAATAWASIACSGCICFSNRVEASLRSPSLQRRAVDVGAVPVRGLHQHAGRAGLDLGARAAHDAGDRRRSVGVGDQHDVGIKRARLPVERLDLLALGCPSDRQLRPGNPVEVEGVQWLPREKHHVVGDVDDVRDRTLPGGHQPRLQPRRARPDRHVLEHARGEPRAQVGALDCDLDFGRRSPRPPGPRTTAAGSAAPPYRRAPRGRRRTCPDSRVDSA